MTEIKKAMAAFVIKQLKTTFPDADIELDYQRDDPWQLLVVVLLSAQTTDKKVNQISRALFERFPSVNDFARAEPRDIEPYIKSIGLYRSKASNLVKAAKKLLEDFDGIVPNDRKKLTTLAGVGNKTSAVVVSNAFNTPSFAVDTHVTRVSRRLGLTKESDPDKIELDLTKMFAEKDWIFAHHALILHGRRVCIARRPHCSTCVLLQKCPQIGVTTWQ